MPLRGRAIRLGFLGHVEGIGLDAHLAEPKVDETLVVQFSLAAFLTVGADPQLIRAEGGFYQNDGRGGRRSWRSGKGGRGRRR